MTDSLEIDPSAVVSPDARIYPSLRGTRVVIGAGCHLEPFALIKCVGGSGDIVIGSNCYINPFCVLYSGNGIRLGNDVLLAPGVKLVPANHEFASLDRPIREQGFRPSKGGIEIGDDVWIGANSIVLDGSRIGDGAIIGAGSLVAGVVPPFEVWGGNPLVRIRAR